MPKVILVLLTLVYLSSCSSSLKIAPENIKNKDLIVFLPGYKGSRLVKKENGSTVWLNFYQLLFGDESIAYDSEDKLIADGVLKEVDVVPLIYSLDIYQECFNFLEGLRNYEVIEFGYDWRDSNTVTASKLRDFILNLHKNGAKSVSIIAHSMGGLSVSHALTYSDSLNIDKIVFLGTVFRGTMIAFLDMNRALDPLPLNKNYYTRKHFVSFKSAYEFLPHPEDKSFYDTNLTNSETLYNIENWKKYSWGPLKNNKNPNLEKLEQDLSYAKNYYESQAYITATCPNSKIVNIRGSGEPVVAKYSFEDSKTGKFSNKKNYQNEDGDSLVTISSSSLPQSLEQCNNTQISIDKLGHNKMCDDKRVQKIIRELFKR